MVRTNYGLKHETSGIYLNGSLFVEEVMKIKEELNVPGVEDFKVLDEWLGK